MHREWWLVSFLLIAVCVLIAPACGDDEDDDDQQEDDDHTADDDTGDDDDDTADDDDDDDDDDVSSDVWVDPNTGLMWQNGADHTTPWTGARWYCEELTWGGYDDWRLPNISRLRSLIRGCSNTVTGGPCRVSKLCCFSECWNDPCSGCDYLKGPGNEGRYWPDELDGDGSWYWSATCIPGSGGCAWGVQFEYGWVFGDCMKAEKNVICMRGIIHDS